MTRAEASGRVPCFVQPAAGERPFGLELLGQRIADAGAQEMRRRGCDDGGVDHHRGRIGRELLDPAQAMIVVVDRDAAARRGVGRGDRRHADDREIEPRRHRLAGIECLATAHGDDHVGGCRRRPLGQPMRRRFRDLPGKQQDFVIGGREAGVDPVPEERRHMGVDHQDRPRSDPVHDGRQESQCVGSLDIVGARGENSRHDVILFDIGVALPPELCQTVGGNCSGIDDRFVRPLQAPTRHRSSRRRRRYPIRVAWCPDVPRDLPPHRRSSPFSMRTRHRAERWGRTRMKAMAHVAREERSTSR